MVKHNYHTQIVSNKVILVPYRPQHVEKYHEWMKSSALLEATASEPLSIEEEYEMQQTWMNDKDKVTFIIIDKEYIPQTSTLPITIEESVECMCGDVNAFLTKQDDPDEPNYGCIVAEMEVMIAEEKSRRKGIAKEAVLLLMNYVKNELNVNCFEVKINEDNIASLALFKEQLHFVEHRYVQVFEEYHFKYPADEILPTIDCQIFNDFDK
jgi:RimJ/RimL family protein N-acetyltransferase